MPENQIAVRIDVDSVRDVDYLPQVLDLLARYNIRATFFITTGPDKVSFNFIKYLTHPQLYLKFFRSKPLRYGLRSFEGLIRTRNVEETCPPVLRQVSEQHEVGLHGYDHYMWMNTLQELGDAAIIQCVKKGVEALKAITGISSRSFASPGFTVTDGMLRALDSFRFDYSSDFKSNAPIPPFYPEIDKKASRVLQVPVSMDSIGELVTKGMKRAEILQTVQANINAWHSAGLPFVFYMHPAYEVGYEADLFSTVLEEWADAHFSFVTLAQIAQQWKVRL